MKTKVASLVVFFLLMIYQSMAQEKITVTAQNDDISNNLDLRAVASVFGESKDLQDFEMRLNDYDSKISNLDLNGDGEVDYLRVIESSENNVHLVVIQAVLGPDVYQDVATIMLEKNQNDRTVVQVIGDSYLYGDNYIVEPVYVYTPSIFSYFWGNGYNSWYSPYYWGYYPGYYHQRSPFAVNYYMNHVFSHINHDYRYYYTDRIRPGYSERLYNSLSRNDYRTRYPDRSFTSRNQNIGNKYNIESSRNNGSGTMQTRPNYQNNESGRRGEVRGNNMGSSTREMNQNRQNQNQSSRSYTPATNSENNRGMNRDQSPVQNNRSVTNSNRETNQSNSNDSRMRPTNVSRENTARPAPVRQPARTQEAKVVQSRPAVNVRSEQPRTVNENNSRKAETERR